MPWNRNDPDPLEQRRRQLAEQQKILTEQRRRLTEQLSPSHESSSAAAKPAEPLVWRNEDEGVHVRAAEPTPARKRNLARQRQRDMVLFFIFILVLIVVLGFVLWVAYVRNTAPVTGT
jgi:hypothetical protein